MRDVTLLIFIPTPYLMTHDHSPLPFLFFALTSSLPHSSRLSCSYHLTSFSSPLSISSLAIAYVSSDHAKKGVKRFRVWHEVIDSERSYLESLLTAIQVRRRGEREEEEKVRQKEGREERWKRKSAGRI